jgi:flagellar biosynthesis protein FliQ
VVTVTVVVVAAAVVVVVVVAVAVAVVVLCQIMTDKSGNKRTLEFHPEIICVIV